MMSEQRFAVIGKPVSHSLSPVIHASFAKQTGICLHYERMEGDEAGFEQQVAAFFAEGGRGLNITLPFKQRAFAMAAVTTQRCAEACAANTLWMKEGVLHADNTDGVGLIRDLHRHQSLSDQNILLLGAGGAARGIIGPLLAAGINKLFLVNRDERKAQALQQVFASIHPTSLERLQGQVITLIINATAASLTDNPLLLPVFLWESRPFCYDLAYCMSEPTSFVATALAEGCQACDGLGMLVEQAAEAFYIWHGIRPDAETTLGELLPQASKKRNTSS